MTAVDELTAAAAYLRKTATEDDRHTAIGGSCFGPMAPDLARLLAAVFDKWEWLGTIDPIRLRRVGGPETLALARAINAHKEGLTP